MLRVDVSSLLCYSDLIARAPSTPPSHSSLCFSHDAPRILIRLCSDSHPIPSTLIYPTLHPWPALRPATWRYSESNMCIGQWLSCCLSCGTIAVPRMRDIHPFTAYCHWHFDTARNISRHPWLIFSEMLGVLGVTAVCCMLCICRLSQNFSRVFATLFLFSPTHQAKAKQSTRGSVCLFVTHCTICISRLRRSWKLKLWWKVVWIHTSLHAKYEKIRRNFGSRTETLLCSSISQVLEGVWSWNLGHICSRPRRTLSVWFRHDRVTVAYCALL